MMSNTVTHKKRGRPATGHDPTTTVRLPQELMERLNAYAAADGISRSEAIRRFVEKGLKGK